MVSSFTAASESSHHITRPLTGSRGGQTEAEVARFREKLTEWLLLRRCNLSSIGDRVYVRVRVSVRVIFSITWPRPDQVATDLVTSVSARYSKSIIAKVRYSLSPPSQRRLVLECTVRVRVWLQRTLAIMELGYRGLQSRHSHHPANGRPINFIMTPS